MMHRLLPALIFLALVIACATTGKLSPQRLDEIVDRCRVEQERDRPRSADMRNLNTDDRNKKRTEQQRYGVDRMNLYKILARFRKLYVQYTAANGTCTGEGCEELTLLRRQIAERCPAAAAGLPDGAAR